MTFWGVYPNGKRELLGEPTEWSVAYNRDAPADMLRAEFAVDSAWEELALVEVCQDGEPVFRGIVDEQNAALDSDGLRVELVCRSLEALLLDSEAPPGTIAVPSLSLLEEKLLKPLGLSLGQEGREKLRAPLTVNKGESCWTALARFCESAYGRQPRVDLAGQVRLEEDGGDLELGEVLSAQVSLLPCKRIGQVWQQSCRGGYDTLYRGGGPTPWPRRYLSRESGKSPKEVLAQGERDSFLLTVTCAGPWRSVRGARASVTLPGLGRFQRCPVRSALYRRDRTGERTRFVLERGEAERKEETICG